MLQTRIQGKDRASFIESLTVVDVLGMSDDTGSLTVFTNDQGGIIDDLIVTKTSLNHVYVVSNAGCRHKDMPLMANAAEAARA
jgi:aminomethyltransferase